MSMETWQGCPGVSSGITSIGVWQERAKSDRSRRREPTAGLRGGAVWNLGRQRERVDALALDHYGHSVGSSFASEPWLSEALGRRSRLLSVSWSPNASDSP